MTATSEALSAVFPSGGGLGRESRQAILQIRCPIAGPRCGQNSPYFASATKELLKGFGEPAPLHRPSVGPASSIISPSFADSNPATPPNRCERGPSARFAPSESNTRGSRAQRNRIHRPFVLPLVLCQWFE